MEEMIGCRVLIGVSEPWEFQTVVGEWQFHGQVIGVVGKSELLITLDDRFRYEGGDWKYVIACTRYVGQRFQVGPDQTANVLLVTDDQALNSDWLVKYDRNSEAVTPWVIGALDIHPSLKVTK